MELRQLEYLLAVIEEQSFTKASAVLGIAQPALSRHVRQLETELGVQLLYRHGRGVRPTEEGAQFKGSVEILLRDLRQATHDLQATSRVPAGEITLGMPPSISATVGAPIVRAFRDRYPQVKLYIVDGFSGFVNEWLVAGRIDMAIINQARRSPLIRVDHLLSVDLFLFGPASLVASLQREAGKVALSSVAGIPLVLPTRNHGLRRELDTAAQQLSLELNIVAEIDALTALKELVRDGMGATILPNGAIYPDAREPGFASLCVVEPDLKMRFTIAYSLQKPVTLGMRELARTIRSEVRAAIGAGRLAGQIDA